MLEFGDIAFGNADIFLRADYSLERIEAIRGGSASTFASNSPGGIINFISKTGDTAGGSVGLTRGLGGYDNTRLDFDYGAPFAEHWQFNVGGFYRRGDGVRDAGYTTDKGGQLKANLTRLFDNGYVRVYAKYLNDRAAGYLPVPTRVSGRDGSPALRQHRRFRPRHRHAVQPVLPQQRHPRRRQQTLARGTRRRHASAVARVSAPRRSSMSAAAGP